MAEDDYRHRRWPDPDRWSELCGFADLIDAWVSLWDSTLAKSEPDPSRVGQFPERERIVHAIGRGYLTCVASSFRGLGQASASWSDYCERAAREIEASSGDPHRRAEVMRWMLDEGLAQLQDLGEISMKEMATLQEKLAQIADDLRQPRKPDSDRHGAPARERAPR